MVESSGLRYKIAFPIPQLFVTAGGSQQAETFPKDPQLSVDGVPIVYTQTTPFQAFQTPSLQGLFAPAFLSKVFVLLSRTFARVLGPHWVACKSSSGFSPHYMYGGHFQ